MVGSQPLSLSQRRLSQWLSIGWLLFGAMNSACMQRRSTLARTDASTNWGSVSHLHHT